MIGQLEIRFDGRTFDPALDSNRLATQLHRVYWTLRDHPGRWYTLPELAEAVQGSETGVAARLRDLRKPKFGGHAIEAERVGVGGTWRYRLAQ